MAAPSPLSGAFRPHVLQGLLIVIASFWIYAPAFHGDWLWDDNFQISENPLMNDPAALWKIWFQPGHSPDYYPLTSTVQWIEWKIWGAGDTLGYHLTNVILHIVNAFLAWRLLGKLGLRLAWLGGLLFAVHPVQVESVAWMAELKNTLSLLPFLCAMCAWIEYESMGRRRDYFLALGLFLVALLAKITVVMFPLVILLYAWWRRSRVGSRDLVNSAPFFVLSLAVGLIPVLTGVWDRVFNHLGPEFVPAGGALARFVLAGSEFAFYFSKCVLPVNLLPIYPKWAVDPSSPIQYLPWAILAGVAIWLWTKRQTWGRHALLGLGFFLLNLLPCPGFIPSPNMGYAWVMDHFLYLPIIGLIGLAVAALGTLPETRSGVAKVISIATLVIVLTLFAAGSRATAKLYQSPGQLWTYTVRHNPGSWMAHLNLGESFVREQHYPEAIAEFEIALKIFPDYPGIRYDLGNALELNGRLSEAIDQYAAVVAVAPNYHDISSRLGQALIEAHRTSEAKVLFENLLRQNPQNAAAHYALGTILTSEGKPDEATTQYNEAARLDPTNGSAHFVLGTAYLKANQLPEALNEFQQAAQVSPRDLDVLGNLGVTLARMGRIQDAAAQFELMLQIDPNSAAAYTNIGSLLMMVGKYPEAVAQYQEALRLDPNSATAQQDLARAQDLQKSHPAPSAAH